MYTLFTDAIYKKIELRKLKYSSLLHRPTRTPEIVELDTDSIVWKVELDGASPQYMCLKHEGIFQDVYVVYVDANRFYKAWLESSPTLTPRNREYCVSRRIMHLDYKFKHAARCFNANQKSPVPLALVSVSERSNGKINISFTDGITRTFWLISNHCKSFPIRLTSREGALLLHNVAGIGFYPIDVKLSR